ncbi:hypothetical protein WH243_03140 [Acinetobacter sp. MYb177]|jgi:hypothetical protein|uniref:hypothetical protein n=1 Tax=unclassified Acinetobacter TaxID=196816 RepID=UPI0030B42020
MKVDNAKELKQAIQSQELEIIINDEKLITQIKALNYVLKLGPFAVAGLIAAIPLIATTGPLGAMAVTAIAPTAAISTSAIVALVVAIGGTIAISLLTDWEIVELPMGIKLKRKQKES